MKIGEKHAGRALAGKPEHFERGRGANSRLKGSDNSEILEKECEKKPRGSYSGKGWENTGKERIVATKTSRGTLRKSA